MSSHNQIWIESDRKLFGSHRQRVLQLFLACLLSISSALGWPFPWFPPRQNEDVSEATPDRSFRMKMSEKSRSTTSRQKPWRGRRDKQKRAGKETASESADPHEPQDRLTLPTGENSESSGFIVMVYDASDSQPQSPSIRRSAEWTGSAVAEPPSGGNHFDAFQSSRSARAASAGDLAWGAGETRRRSDLRCWRRSKWGA